MLSFVLYQYALYLAGKDPYLRWRKELHHDYFEVQGEHNFYLWGLTPEEQTVELDTLAMDQGMVSAANFSIREYQSFGNMLMTFVTLGLITPMNYEIKGFGVLKEKIEIMMNKIIFLLFFFLVGCAGNVVIYPRGCSTNAQYFPLYPDKDNFDIDPVLYEMKEKKVVAFGSYFEKEYRLRNELKSTETSCPRLKGLRIRSQRTPLMSLFR